MANDVQIAIRVSRDLADRLKDYAAELSGRAGVPVSLASAARKLLEDGLEAEQPAPKRRRRA